MDIEKIKNKYEEMPIEALALFLESYDKNDFTKEAQEIINKVLEKRKKELDEYEKQMVGHENSGDLKEPLIASKFWLFGFILIVPLVGFLVATGIQAHFNSDLRTTLREEFLKADKAVLDKMTVDRLCENPSPEIRDLCRTNTNLNLMKYGAIGAVAVNILLLIAIRLAGIVARSNRNLLH